MIRLIRDQLRKRADRFAIREAVRDALRFYNALGQVEKLEFAIALAVSWRAFLTKYPDGSASFVETAKGDQDDYVRKLRSYTDEMFRNGQPRDAAPAGLFSLYLCAVVSGDSDLENEVAAALDPIARKGWAMSAPLAAEPNSN